MTKHFTRILVLLLLLIPGINYAQTNLIYFEDFEHANLGLINLNSGDVGSNNGPNKWLINNLYKGQPIFPNTISEDSTFGGLITHPDSNYLHINDVNIVSVGNANFDPTLPSDRFVTLGPFCTLGLDSIHFAFFYLCMGNLNSFGQVYYKADGGPWTLYNGGNYSGIYKWKYEDITDPAFADVQNLQFGFRWENGNSTDTTSSFAIDDIKIVGTYNPAKYPVHITIPQIIGAPVCQNSSLLIEIDLSQPLCGLGNYTVQLSGPGGSFSNPYNAGNFAINNFDSVNFVNITIPSNSPADTCYKLRVIRTDITPFIYSDTSICFQVIKCPNTITTLQPVVLSNPLDTICVGSVIDVPFLSTGVFVNNTYIAQLSDSTGNFTTPINVLGSLHSSLTFPGPPGTVSGIVLPNQQPIPPGCNYYIRVISTNPATIGSVYGPFCIRDCDIKTNKEQDIHVCVSPTVGLDTIIPVDINVFDSSEVYLPTDSFEVQVLSSLTFAVINTGGLGFVVSDSGTFLHLHIPGLIGLNALGIGTGVYYVRVVATASNEKWNTLGTLIRLTIGSPFPTPLDVQYLDINTFNLYDIPDTTVCVGSTLFYEVDPLAYNSGSIYSWTLNNNNQWPGTNDGFEDYTGIIFNGAGVDYLSVIESNFGCVGPGSDTVKITVLGTPSVAISGPAQVCIGDTVHYSVSLQDQTYYTWSTTTGTILDTANNNLTITFAATGTSQIAIHAVGLCGVADGTKTILVKAYPTVNAGNDTTVCRLDTVNLSTTSGSYTYLWSNGGTSRTIAVAPDSTTTYVIASTVLGSAGCTSRDTVTIFVKNPVQSQIADSICPRQPITLDPGVGSSTYLWSNGATTQTITVKDTGTFAVNFKTDTAICKTQNTYTIKFMYPNQNGVDTVICPGGAVSLDAGVSGGVYYWSNNDSSKVITVHDTGTYTLTILEKNGKCDQTRLYRVSSEGCVLHFPNVITPNSDGFNDFWFNLDRSIFTVFDVKIFDRWGLLIYESSDSQFKWDGRNKQGKKVSDGVYYYIVSAGSSLTQQKVHGFVTVLN